MAVADGKLVVSVGSLPALEHALGWDGCGSVALVVIATLEDSGLRKVDGLGWERIGTCCGEAGQCGCGEEDVEKHDRLGN